MDMSLLDRINETTYTIKEKAKEGAPIRLFGNRLLFETMDDKVLEQIRNVSMLPGLVFSAMTMPDAHWGYGFPIGGVAAFDPREGGIISAGGVGFDISCGIRFLRSNLLLEDLADLKEDLANILFARIPAGVGKEGSLKLNEKELDRVIENGARWALKQGYGTPEDLEYIEENGRIDGAVPDYISGMAKSRQRGEMGTLGSGNHYLEVQVVDRIYDKDIASAFGLRSGQIVISIHCGSRGLGHQIGTEYLVSLAKAAKRLGIVLPDRELACAPILSEEGQEYLGAMNGGINVALANRQMLAHLTRNAFFEIFPGSRLDTVYDVSHNTCKREIHEIDGQKRELYVHRKGATRAFGPGHRDLPERYRKSGQPVIIGGSMGTGSFILAGTTEGESVSLSSASHGAGRRMSRRQAAKRWDGHRLIDELGSRGIILRSRSLRGLAEEAPGAYKDVDLVAQSTEEAKLARRVAYLRPVICVKG